MQYWNCNRCQENLVTKNYVSSNSKVDAYTLIYICKNCNNKNFINTKNAIEIHGAKVVKFLNTNDHSKESITKVLKRHNLS